MTGCYKLSPGCENCYMFPLAKRLQSMGSRRYTNGTIPTFHPEALKLPKLKDGSRVFVNSMSDVYLSTFPLEQIRQGFDVMNTHPKLDFQILT
ncbi:MAG: DUF5131 family protein, partial [Patescibacteria group bacterium]